ncbi:hypothetical protein AOA80_09560 [Methanomassiliicoccales archaeon RumEn M1]|nr:hypothetical protein AOA80_09560 [Methanomassiliicoccales archaeon RumEn M1]
MLLLMLSGIGGVSADTYVGGGLDEIEGGYDWDENGSTYIVNETIYVEAGETLTIGPGVKVLFGPDAGIVVNGTLVVEGNDTHKVVFDSNPFDDSEDAWAGLHFNAGSGGAIDHAIINDTQETLRAIDCELTVTNTAITNTNKAVYAEFENGGSLTIDNCVIDAQPGSGASIAVMLSSFADDERKNTTAFDITITNNLINTTNPYGLIYIYKDVEAEDNGTATLVGDILIADNVFNQTSMVSNFIYMGVDLEACDNAIASIKGNFTVVRNEMLQAGYGACYLDIDVWAEDNATAQTIGDIVIEDNLIENVEYAPYIYFDVWAEDNATARIYGNVCVKDNFVESASDGLYVALELYSEGYGEICVVGDVYMNGNNLEDTGGVGSFYNCFISAEDNSTVSVDGDVYMNGNTIAGADVAFGAYWETSYIKDNATVEILACLFIEDNCVDEAGCGFEVSIGGYDYGEYGASASQDASVHLHVDVAIRNNVIGYVDDLLDAFFGTADVVTDRASYCVGVSFLFEGNQAVCVSEDGICIIRRADAEGQAEAAVNVEISIVDNKILLDRESSMAFEAMCFNDYVDACDEAVAAVSGNLIIADNDVADNGPSSDSWRDKYLIYLHRTVNGEDNATSTLCGDILITGNELDAGEAFDCDYLYMEEELNANDNATVQVIRDIVMENNELLGSGDDAFWPSISVYAGGENSTATLEGELRFCKNYIEDAGYGPYIDVEIEAEGYGKVIVCQPVFVCGNEATEVGYFVCYYPEIEYAEDKATVTFDGPLTVSGNTICDVGGEFVYYDVDLEAYDEATVTLDSELTVSGNTVGEYCYDFVGYYVDIMAVGSANVDAIVPMTATCNTFVVGGSMVEAEVYVNVRNNATASLCNDVVVQGNSMEGDDIGYTKAPAGEGSYDYGLKLFQYVRVIADGALASGTIESEVLFDGNTIVAEDLVGMNVYRGAHAYGGGADAVACIIGDVMATNNDIAIEGDGVGITGGAQTRAGANQGNASAVVDTLFCISNNKIEMEDGMGIVAVGIDYGADDESGVNNSATELNIEFVIRDNCVTLFGEGLAPVASPVYENVGIYVAVLSEEPGLSAGVTIDGNTIDVRSGIGIKVDDNYRGDTYEVGSVVIIRNNDITVGPSGTGIYIKGGEVCIIDNDVKGGEYGARFDYCEGIEFDGNTFKGNEYGIYALGTREAVIEGNAFLENGCGVHLSDDEGTVVRDNFFAKNEQGLMATGSIGLVIEDCYFYMNGGGAYLDEVEGVVADCTFYLNLGNGLSVDDSELIIYNGEYDQNRDYGLRVVGDSVDWIVDAEAVVHANDVTFAGEIVICGTLVLDYVDDFVLLADDDVVNGIYDATLAWSSPRAAAWRRTTAGCTAMTAGGTSTCTARC